MENLHRKTVAVGAVLALCLTAFAGIVVSSDDSDAATTTVGITKGKVYSGTVVGYIISDTGEAEYSATVPGVTFSLGTPNGPTHPIVIRGTPTTIGAYDVTVTTFMNGSPVVSNLKICVANNATQTATGEYEVRIPLGVFFKQGYAFGPSDNTGFNGSIPGIDINSYTSGPMQAFNLEGTPTAIGSYRISSTTGGLNSYTFVVYGIDHAVSYSANGGTGTMSNTVVSNGESGNSDVTLASCGFSKAGYEFVGWKIGNVIYQPGQTVPVEGNTTVNAVAQWTPINVNIISSGEGADIIVGNSFSRTITTDVAGATLSFTGPGWLTLSGSTLVGTPSVAGDYTVTVTAALSASSDSQTFTIHVVNRLAFESVPTGGILATPVI